MWKRYRATIASAAIVLVLLGLTYAGTTATDPTMRAMKTVHMLLSGLTLAALYFLLAAGLSLIFGLMDVLNFAHGVLFMIGAYVGYSTFGNPRLLLNTLPLVLLLVAGAILGAAIGWPLRSWEQSIRRRWAHSNTGGLFKKTVRDLLSRLSLSALLVLLAVVVLFWATRGFPLDRLVAFEATATGGAIPTSQAQEAISRTAVRLLQIVAAGLLLGLALASEEREKARWQGLGRPLALSAGMALVGVLLLIWRDPLERFFLDLPVNLRFLLALLAGAGVGALLGGLIERTLVRPFYGRVVTQIVLTLGLMFVGVELVESVWGQEGRPPMAVPTFFAQSCRSDNLGAWLTEQCSSVSILGRAFPTYRLMIIAVGLVILVGVGLLLRYSRLGMIIRAGVQDSEMVEALGINVRRVFTLVFALGSGLAALGGVVAAPFVGVYPEMGATFQLQAFIAVVIGGMGSYAGTAIGALLLGLARAFGDALVTGGITMPWAEQALQASPAVARASTVLIMAIVLLVRPAGIFGRKE